MTETTAQEAMQSFFERLIERHPEQRERFMHYINMTDEEREQLQKEQARADEEFSRQAYRNLQARKKEALWKMSLWNGNHSSSRSTTGTRTDKGIPKGQGESQERQST